MPVSRSGRDLVIWFRPEVLQTVTWGGDPNKPVETSADGQQRLTPRKSFAAWKQAVEGSAIAWKPTELEAALELRQAVVSAALNAFAPDGTSCAVVMLTGVGDETLAVAAMQAGAEDYLVKASLTPAVLHKAIEKAIERFELRRNLEREQRRCAVILESISDAFFSLDRNGRFTYVNPASRRLINFDAPLLLGHCITDLFVSEPALRFQDEIARAVRENRAAHFEIITGA